MPHNIEIFYNRIVLEKCEGMWYNVSRVRAAKSAKPISPEREAKLNALGKLMRYSRRTLSGKG